jgi:molybdopterin synthase sulfur carrier subunit
MPTVFIPALLRDLTGGRESMVVEGQTVRDLIENLDAVFPGLKQRLCIEGGLRPGVAVAVDGITSPLGWRQLVRADSEVHFVPAIGGG